MNKLAISSLAYGANVRASASFGNNIEGFLLEGSLIQQTGPQQGDRWLPVKAEITGITKDVFVSKNVVRAYTTDAREALVRAAVSEWVRFDREKGKEHIAPYFRFVEEYWNNIGMDLTGKDRGWPWSAAYISWCIEQTGMYPDFKQAAAHSRYTHQAIRRREDNVNGSFWGFRISEHAPQVGDMVCLPRGSFKATYDHATTENQFSSHNDIVIAVRDDHVSTLGGNVSHTVKRKTFSIDANGFLKSSHNGPYAVMRNNL